MTQPAATGRNESWWQEQQTWLDQALIFGSIVPVLDALEEQVALLRLFSAVPADDVTVSIGEENLHDGLVETAVVAGTYGSENANAHLAVVGPVRMDYVNAMSSVHAVGAYLTHFLHGNRS